MTVPSDASRSGPYHGNNVTTAFDYDFKITDETHLLVVVRDDSGDERTLVLTADYTVSGVGNDAGGAITTTVAPIIGEDLTILRNVPFVQETDLENQGAYNAETVEDALDLAVMRDQQLKEGLDRAVKMPENLDPSGLNNLVADIIRLGASADAIDTVADIAPQVVTVAGIDDEVVIVAGIHDSVTTVAGVAADVSAVAAVATDIPTVAANVADITNFADVYQGPKADDPTTRNDGSALQPGDLYFNTTVHQLRTFDGTGWQSVTDQSLNISAKSFVGDGVSTEFTLDANPGIVSNLMVEVGGVLQTPTTDYTHLGTTLTLLTAPGNGVAVNTWVFATTAELNVPADGTSTWPVYSIAELKSLPITRRGANLIVSGIGGLFDFMEGDFSAFVTADTLSGIYVKADDVAATAGAWVRRFDGYVYPEWFGAKGDNATDDGPSLAAAVALCGLLKKTLRLGNKYYRSSVSLNLSAVPIVYAERATIVPTFAEGTAIVYMASAGNLLFGPKVLGELTVEWPAVDYSKERWSFLFQNVYKGEFHISTRRGTLGIFCYGNQRGVVYNDFYLGFIEDNQVGVYMDSADASGWVNMNRFHGGFFTGTQASQAGIYSDRAGHIFLDGAPYTNNGNIFIDPSLEWIGPNFKLARIGGLRNYLRPRYMEMDAPTAGTSAPGSWIVDFGQQNTIDVSSVPYADGYDPLLGAASRIDASGAIEPRIIGRLGYFDMGAIGSQRFFNNHAIQAALEAANNGDGPALRLRNNGSAGLPALEIVGPSGSAGVKLPAAGVWTVYNGSRQVIWNAVVAPAAGTWRRGDLAFNIEPSPGGSVGWVCTADGTPGTWKAFGSIAA